jgi:hypothetical protein
VDAAVSRGPYLSWMNDPETTMTVTWQTTLPESAAVEYGSDTTDTDTIVSPVADTVHSVEIAGLKSSSKYFYKVKSDTQFHSFKTAVTGREPFTFCVLGDTRTDSTVHRSVVNRIAAIAPDFMLHVGDLVYSGSSSEDWNAFFEVQKDLMHSTPFMPSIGNHDWPFTTYHELFCLPGNEKWYSFDYGNVHFVALDTESDLVGPQRDWLEDDLLSASVNPETDWIIAFFHRAPYCKGGNGADTAVENAWCNLFETYDVDLVFSGHNHFYQRTHPINDVVYVVTAGGGGPLYDPDTASWIAHSEKTYHCCKIEVNGLALKTDAIRPDGTVFDSFAMRLSVEQDRTESSSVRSLQSCPNPFVQSTVIRYQLSAKSEVLLSIHDVTGRVVRTLVNGQKEAGSHSVTWNAEGDHSQDGCATGLYFARLVSGNHEEVRKLFLTK